MLLNNSSSGFIFYILISSHWQFWNCFNSTRSHLQTEINSWWTPTMEVKLSINAMTDDENPPIRAPCIDQQADNLMHIFHHLAAMETRSLVHFSLIFVFTNINRLLPSNPNHDDGNVNTSRALGCYALVCFLFKTTNNSFTDILVRLVNCTKTRARDATKKKNKS